MSRNLQIILAAGATLAIAGCRAVGPDYARPEVASPERFVNSLSVPSAEAASIARWWERMNDSTLSSLVDRAVIGNLDLKLAASRVREARALRGVAAAGDKINLNAGTGASRSRASERTENAFGAEQEATRFDVGLDAAWEVDLFGAVRRGVEAADADLAAAEEGGREVLVSLAAEVATAYVDLRSFQARMGVVENAIRVQKETVELLNARLEAGLSAELEIQQATAQLALRESRMPPLVTGARRSMYRLAVLLGQAPGALVDELSPVAAVPHPAAELPIGAPSELLLRRPDLRRLERELAAETARIGVTTADLYPRLTLNGSFAFEAADPGRLFNMDARTWSIGPALKWNLLDGGRARRQVEAADERSRAALIAYESRFLLAMEEVENSLVSFEQQQTRRSHLATAVTANQRAVQLATDRYTSGVGGFLDVLDGQRTLYDAEEDLVASDTEVTIAYVSVFRALGGGWDPADVTVRESPAQP